MPPGRGMGGLAIPIIINQVLPIAVLVIAGMLLNKLFPLDIRTMTKLLFYIFFPAICFILAYESNVTAATVLDVLLFLVIFYAALLLIVELYVRVRRLRFTVAGAVRNSVMLDNNGNYGIPLNQLVFMQDAFALSVQMIVMMTQTFLLNTFGLYNVSGRMKWSRLVKTMAAYPSLYCMAAGFVLNASNTAIPGALLTPIQYMAQGFLAFALLTLGVQLGQIKWSLGNRDIAVSIILKLCAAPLLGLIILLLLGMEGILAQALLLTCTVPASLAGVLLAMEFGSEPDFTAQTAFLSTLFSVVSVSFWIYVIQHIW
ncbi:AEC family transporter [Paenibacillus sp. sgz302251]|uniref:AEC family transporter n=1 Tax=Paenibacillus sp. sgz302251 TaxID=3414493 RepID=UPI003C7AC19D